MEMLSFNSYCLVSPACSSTKAMAILISETQSNMKKDGFSAKVVIVLL